MVRVTVNDNDAELELLVEGKLTWPCVSELQAVWNQTRQSHGGRKVVIDLSGMTTIDASGKEALMRMIRQGARLASMGVYNRYPIQELVNKALVVEASRQRG
jgi:threonine dehydrogenase-like Zn-dependent dehydrogenase